jgi:hypothetical protein
MVALLVFASAATAAIVETFETETAPSTGVASKVAIDVIEHPVDPRQVWLATGKGGNYSSDDGASWFVANIADGLPSDNLSAIFSLGGRLWVGSNHNEFISDRLMTISDGLSYSDDDGETWVNLDFGANGFNIPYVQGGDRSVFDITGHIDLGFFNNRTIDNDAEWLFFAAFAGGLLASQDNGESWRRIYSSSFDSIQYSLDFEAPSLRNRYFSCVADTSHGDSLFLWTGTAGGVFQYVFAPPGDKMYSHTNYSGTLCGDCLGPEQSGILIAGEGGLVLTNTETSEFATRFELDGLPRPRVMLAHTIGDRILVSTAEADSVIGGSYLLAYSDDQAESFTTISQPWPTGQNRRVTDLVNMSDRLYAAVEQSGLWVSPDSGLSWTEVVLAPPTVDPSLQHVNALAVDGDTLLLGTNGGLLKLELDAGGAILSYIEELFQDTDSTGARVTRVKKQTWVDTNGFDQTALWTINQPLAAPGIPHVAKLGVEFDIMVDTVPDPDVITYDTTGFRWDYYRRGLEIHDMNFFSDTVFVVGPNAIWFSPRGEEMTNFFSARQYVDDTLVVANLDQDTVYFMEVMADTVLFGTNDGMAISHDRGESFRIFRANTDTLAADVVINHNALGTMFGLAGDFIPALGVQYVPGAPARIWAGARPAEVGSQGISVGEFDPADGSLNWQTVYNEDFAWNLEFAENTIFAATNLGLLMTDGPLDSLDTQWETIDFIDQASGQILVESGTAVYGVGIVDPYLWVGTDDGTVRLEVDNLGSQELFTRVDSTTAADEVYAFPVPFSPNTGGRVDFHFQVEQSGNVTVKIYDFAMNLVATPIDNVYYSAGIYPAQGTQGITWDGYNDNGDLVAVGVYYFKVEYESGETRWGKLAVIP